MFPSLGDVRADRLGVSSAHEQAFAANNNQMPGRCLGRRGEIPQPFLTPLQARAIKPVAFHPPRTRWHR